MVPGLGDKHMQRLTLVGEKTSYSSSLNCEITLYCLSQQPNREIIVTIELGMIHRAHVLRK